MLHYTVYQLCMSTHDHAHALWRCVTLEGAPHLTRRVNVPGGAELLHVTVLLRNTKQTQAFCVQCNDGWAESKAAIVIGLWG